MLELPIPNIELFDEDTETFITIPEQRLQLEHSLISLSKWESKWCKPFLTEEPKTREETLDYIRCMTINYKNVNPLVYKYMPSDCVIKVEDYIKAPMTATWFGTKTDNPNRKGGSLGKRIITNELIYYYMITLQIPVEFERWHLKRLLTLIQVCQEENKPAKKVNRSTLLRNNQALNRARRAKYNTTG